MRRHRMFVLGASLLATALVAGACGSGGDDTGTAGGGTSASAPARGDITVGVSGAFPENQLVAEMYAQVLENAGYTVSRELDIDAREVGNAALESGKIDLKPEYTGFDLPLYDKKAPTNGSPEEVAAELKAALEPLGLVTYAISPANSTNVFVVTPETAQANNLTDMSSLAPVAGQLTLGAPPDCPKAAFCIPGMKQTYGRVSKFGCVPLGYSLDSINPIARLAGRGGYARTTDCFEMPRIKYEGGDTGV